MWKNKPADICWTLQSHLHPFPLGCFFWHYCRRSAAPPRWKPSRVHGCQPGRNNNGLEICSEKMNKKKILPSRFIKRNKLKRLDSELKAARFIRQMMDSSIRSSASYHSITSWGFVGELDHHGTEWEKKEQSDLQHPCCGRTIVEALLTCIASLNIEPPNKVLSRL